jgi:hypothetical protein
MPIRQAVKTQYVLPVGHLEGWAEKHGLACGIDTLNGKDVLGGVDSNGYDSHDFLFQLASELMTMKLPRTKRFASPSWHSGAVNRNPDGTRLAWDGEVPYIR